jgi:hypothetical protein
MFFFLNVVLVCSRRDSFFAHSPSQTLTHSLTKSLTHTHTHTPPTVLNLGIDEETMVVAAAAHARVGVMQQAYTHTHTHTGIETVLGETLLHVVIPPDENDEEPTHTHTHTHTHSHTPAEAPPPSDTFTFTYPNTHTHTNTHTHMDLLPPSSPLLTLSTHMGDEGVRALVCVLPTLTHLRELSLACADFSDVGRYL